MARSLEGVVEPVLPTPILRNIPILVAMSANRKVPARAPLMRPHIYSRRGGVASRQPLAASAGVELLSRGGSAVDAAIAASAVLAVTEPGDSHLGGDLFAIHHSAKDRKTIAINGSGEAPHNAFPSEFSNGIPLHGYKAATVPGLVSGWFAVHELWGRRPMAEILTPAIRLAREGFPATPGLTRRITHHIKNFPETKVFDVMQLATDLERGDVIRLPDLASSLEEIAKNGRDAFYRGAIAERIVAATSGWFSLDDLARHHTRIEPPLTAKYRDQIIHAQPPPSQGMILATEMLLADRMELASMSEVDRIHFLVEAKKIGFADRYRTLGDSDETLSEVERVLSRDHISKRLSEIDMSRARLESLDTTEGSDTTYLLAVDEEGNAISWIQSVFHGFGASFAIDGTGILLNNRLTGFSLDPASPNFIAPGKRPAHTLNAFIVTHADGSLHLVSGTPGANIQVQTNAQVISAVIDLGMSAQEAVEAPRWQHLVAPGESAGVEGYSGHLQLESRFDPETIEGLRRKGHDVSAISPLGHGSAVQLLRVLPNGTFEFGSDPRCEGLAIGL
ncbi:MAG: gamma-glutamyltransferase family protein [Candidatus Nanopelagicaceae bacterium]